MTVGVPVSCLIPMFTYECNLIKTFSPNDLNTDRQLHFVLSNYCTLSSILFEHLEHFCLDVFYEVLGFLCNDVLILQYLCIVCLISNKMHDNHDLFSFLFYIHIITK